MSSDREIVERMRERSTELRSVLDDYGSRLRRMRERNRQLEAEIGEFEHELERLRDWLDELGSG